MSVTKAFDAFMSQRPTGPSSGEPAQYDLPGTIKDFEKQTEIR